MLPHRYRSGPHLALLAGLALAWPAAVRGQAAAGPRPAPEGPAPDGDVALRLTPCALVGSADGMLCGTMRVPEDRTRPGGRTLELRVAVIPAELPEPRPEPVFYFAGGPGQAATPQAWWLRAHWMRALDRDLVLVDQRGTAGAHELQCPLPGSPDPQAGLRSAFADVAAFVACRDSLSQTADLRFYGTLDFTEDVDAVRAALGYERIILAGGSYGTRAALAYMRRHPDRVAAALLQGVAPPSFTNPLYHAYEAQRALDGLLADCAAEPRCHRAFPDVRRELRLLLDRVEADPPLTTIRDPDTGVRTTVRLHRYGLAEGLRALLYGGARQPSIPSLIHGAFRGDYRPLAELGLAGSRGMRRNLALGLLLSVTCSEDAPRIRPDSIPALTEDTFLGDTRVRTQLAVCEIWPRSRVDERVGEPVRTDAPVLLLSGRRDPVTAPRWAARALRTMTNGLHIIVPGGHGVGGLCVHGIAQTFLRELDVDTIDTRCVAGLRAPPFEVP